MANEMADPYIALKSFQEALRSGDIFPSPGEAHQDLLVLLDKPNGEMRLTYALVKDETIVAIAMFIAADPFEGYPCFNSGYAVDESHRSKGFGKEVTSKAFDEMTNGFKRSGVPHLYVEAVISQNNTHSNKLAKSLFSDSPDAVTDSESGQPALHYLKKLY
ncbi:MAG: GNAT family N-acetyltransferase [Pseudomonadota bacterium]